MKSASNFPAGTLFSLQPTDFTILLRTCVGLAPPLRFADVSTMAPPCARHTPLMKSLSGTLMPAEKFLALKGCQNTKVSSPAPGLTGLGNKDLDKA